MRMSQSGRSRTGVWRALVAVAFVWSVASTLHAASMTFTTFAGSTGGPGSDDGTGTAAHFGTVNGVAVDSSGNVYVADTGNQIIRKISSAGVVSTFAGTTGNTGLVDGKGAAASFTSPNGVAVDSKGNVYVADTDNNCIRKITAAGFVSTLAGTQTSGSADGTGAAASFSQPNGVAVDLNGNVFVADTQNHTIRKITPAGVVTTLAGSAGSTGSIDAIGVAARFNLPTSVAVDINGNVYVADSKNQTIRKITLAGVVTTLAGTAGVTGNTNGTGPAASFFNPFGVAVDGGGNVYVAEAGNCLIRRITPGGTTITLAGSIFGSADGTGAAAQFATPDGVAVDGSGTVFVADANFGLVRKVTSLGVTTTLAGTVGNDGSTDGQGTQARFSNPFGVGLDSGGNLFVADNGDNQTIREISPTGTVTTYAGTPGTFNSLDGTGSNASFNNPSGIAVNSNIVYVGDSNNNEIRTIAPGAVVTTLAGTTTPGSADGTPGGFRNPNGVAVDGAGNVYVADTGNNTIRKISNTVSVVSTFAGTAGLSGSADGTGTAARFSGPTGVAVDINNNVYVADQLNHTIRKITSAGVVTTLAGLAGNAGSADGTGVAARFNSPYSLAVDTNGNVYVTDSINCTIRMITPVGVVTTLGGLAGFAGSSDGTGSAARFFFPAGIAVTGSGSTLTLYIGDKDNFAIRIGRPALADTATIDSNTGFAGSMRQLDVAPQSATSYAWSIVREPSGSKATLSSTSIRNPTFVPDVADVFIFRVTAKSATGTSISTVNLTSMAIPPPLITALSSSENPGFLGDTINFAFSATDNISTNLTYTLDFGDNSPPATGTFGSGSVVNAPHVYSTGNNFTVTLTVSNITSMVQQTLTEMVPTPSSAGLGVTNISNNKDPVMNPLDGLKIAVVNSNGGVMKLGIDVSALNPSAYAVQTNFADVPGNTATVMGMLPVHPFARHGLFVADVTATDMATNAVSGHGRKTLAMSTKETGDVVGDKALADPPSQVIATKMVKGKFAFSGLSTDLVSFNGSFVLPPGLDTSKTHEVQIGIGNIIGVTMLDARGNATGVKPPLSKMRLSYQKVKKGAITQGGETAVISASISASGMVRAGFDTEGISATAKDASTRNPGVRSIQIAILLDGVSYETLATVQFIVSSAGDFGVISGRAQK